MMEVLPSAWISLIVIIKNDRSSEFFLVCVIKLSKCYVSKMNKSDRNKQLDLFSPPHSLKQKLHMVHCNMESGCHESGETFPHTLPDK